jgi:hypothetical protein
LRQRSLMGNAMSYGWQAVRSAMRVGRSEFW